jgi:hypothetical protein
MTPWLELYVALRRTAEAGKYILEEPIDGAPIVAAVLFQEGEGEAGAPPATNVVLRVSYLLPREPFPSAWCTLVSVCLLSSGGGWHVVDSAAGASKG